MRRVALAVVVAITAFLMEGFPSIVAPVPVEATIPATWPQLRHDGRRTAHARVPGPYLRPTSIRLVPRAREHYSNLIVGLAGRLLFSAFWYDGWTEARDVAIVSGGNVVRLPTLRGCAGAPAQRADGTTHVICPDGLVAFGPDGLEKWRWPSTAPLSSLVLGLDGAPYLIAGGTTVVALDKSGVERWRHVPPGGRASALSVGDDGAVYYIGHFENFVRALASDGSPRWTYETDHPVTTAPVVDRDGAVYVVARNIYGIDPDGMRRWVDSPPRNISAFEVVYATLALGDGVLYMGQFDDYGLTSISTATGQRLWVDGLAGAGAPIVGSDGIVYLPTERGVQAFNGPRDLLWELDLGRAWSGSADLALGPNRTLFAATESGLYILK